MPVWDDLTPEAKQDIRNSWLYTVEHLRERQADGYVGLLEAGFWKIWSGPSDSERACAGRKLMAATSRNASMLDGLDTWVCAHNPDPSLSYGKGWWDGIEFMRKLRDQHGLETVDVPATYLMETPPPCETLLMPVYRIWHQSLECYLKTDFGLLLPNWFLSIRTPERLIRTYGLFDPSRDWRREPRYLDGFQEAWRYPPCAESPLCFTCAVDSEMDVYMLIRLLIGTPGVGQRDPLLRR